LDIQNTAERILFSGYPKKFFSDIRNNILRYPEKDEYFGYQEKYFPISEIIISDINKCFCDITKK